MSAVDFLVLLISLAFLAKSAEIVINSSARLAAFFGISHIALGFVLLSTATSLPELSVSVVSSAVENGAIAAGNIFGSNTADILLVLGIGASLYRIRIERKEIEDVALILLGTSVITLAIIYLVGLGRIEGTLLLALFTAYVLYLARRRMPSDAGERVAKSEALRAFLWFGAGIAVVLVSAGFVVGSAVRLAEAFGLAKSFIGATIIALGTSLPELTLDLQALRTRRYGLALGDALGSSMTNITLVLGVAALLNPIIVNMQVFMPIVLSSLIANLILFYFISTRRALGRREGLLMVAVYLLFLLVVSGAQLLARGRAL